jgi:thiol-disulfide isomerase/thioredoxin
MTGRFSLAVGGLCVAVTALAGARAYSRHFFRPIDSAAADANAGEADRLVAAPEFPAGLEWLQGGPLKLAELRGRVAAVHFWTNGCINCKHNYPVYRAWQEKYDSKKFVLVGIHTPEFAAEAPADRVKKAARDNGLTFPIVLDPQAAAWKSWGNQYWPSIYLVDKRGRIRARWEGELHLDTADGRRFAATIDALLKEQP